MLCAGLLASERLELRIQCSARFLLSLHRFARLLSPALGWGPALKILLWCDESCTGFCDAEFWCDISASIGFTMFSDLLQAFHGSMSAPVWNRGPSTMFPERTCTKACKREVRKIDWSFLILQKAYRVGFTESGLSCRPSLKRRFRKFQRVRFTDLRIYGNVAFV